MSSTTSPWYGFTTSNVVGTWNSGWSWGANAAYPAAGRRNFYDGDLFYVGITGYYWSASPYSSNASYDASYLYFYSGSVNVDSLNYRASGSTVRCVKE
jgi:hypothetical protein